MTGKFNYHSWVPGYNWSYTIYNENSVETLYTKIEQVINDVTGLLGNIGININKYDADPAIFAGDAYFKNYILNVGIYKNEEANVAYAVFNLKAN